VSLHAKEQELGKVSCLETRRLDAIRIFYHGDDRHEYHHSHDEGTAVVFGYILCVSSFNPSFSCHHSHQLL